MKIETFYPEHPLLKDSVEYYYFQKTDAFDFCNEYYAFPNTLQALNIHKNISCEIDSHLVKVTGIGQDSYTMILQGRFSLPLHVQQKGRINKVTIIFKPLGLNHFIKSPYNEIAGEPTQIFTEWNNDKNCPAFLDMFYREPNNKIRIQILEKFLVMHYASFSQAAMLISCDSSARNRSRLKHSIEVISFC